MAKQVTAKDVVKQLKKHLGENGSYYWKKYGLASGTPWCCAAVSASFADAGAKKYFYDGKPVFYVPYAQEWLHKNAKHVKLSDVQCGDIVIFTWSGKGYNKEQGSTRDHIGFARAASSGNKVFTIEGNTSNGIVAERTRDACYIYGIYRTKIPYTTTTTANVVASKPASSESLAVDGIFGIKTKKKMQKWLKVAEDGEIGKKTIKKLQKVVGAKQDGIWGTETTTKLQEYLTKKGFTTKVTKKFDKATIKQLQKFLNNYFKDGDK